MVKSVLASLPPDPIIHIRPVRMTDINALHQGCLAGKPGIWINHLVTRACRNFEIDRGIAIVIIDPQSEEIIAFGQYTAWTNCGEISDLIVQEQHRRKGLGTALIQYLVQYARSVNAPCVEIGAASSNPLALKLYLRLGFTKARTICVDLGKGKEDVILLRLAL